MKIQLASDLHLEFKGPYFDFNTVEKDVLVLAGDIHLGSKADEFIMTHLRKTDVVYLLGNHELYGQVVPKLKRAWAGPVTKRINEEAETFGYPGRLHYLDNTVAEIQGVRFLGGTLWTDIPKEHVSMIERGMNDYHQSIMRKGQDGWAGGDIKMSVHNTVGWHRETVKFLTEELSKDFDGKTVVVTHHLPSFKSVHPQYTGSILNHGFASDLDSLIEETQPDIWFHGHTHSNCDYKIGKTWVLCNPRGYHGYELNTGFRNDFVVEV
jgi:Icc-related predicted phosphoesterase